MKYTIVIPAYNEEGFITSTLKDLSKYLSAQKMDRSTEVIVVAAKGGDGTAELARRQQKKFKELRVIELPNKVGKGRDVKVGLVNSRGSYVLFMDADLATPLHHIKPLFTELQKNQGLVYGVRNLGTMHNSFFRKATSRLGNSLVQKLLMRGVEDSQCGFKGMDKDVLDLVLEKSVINGWGFDFELFSIINKACEDIPQTPIRIDDWKDPKGTEGLAGERKMLAMLRTLKELVVVKKNSILRKYN